MASQPPHSPDTRPHCEAEFKLSRGAETPEYAKESDGRRACPQTIIEDGAGAGAGFMSLGTGSSLRFASGFLSDQGQDGRRSRPNTTSSCRVGLALGRGGESLPDHGQDGRSSYRGVEPAFPSGAKLADETSPPRGARRPTDWVRRPGIARRTALAAPETRRTALLGWGALISRRAPSPAFARVEEIDAAN